MQKKKILHLITGLEIGGAEKMLLNTLPIIQNDFENRVCSIIGHGPIGTKLEKAGIVVYYLDLKNIFDLRIIFRFRKIIKEFKPDILITYLIHADLFGRIFGRIFGVKKIVCSQRGSLLQWEFLRTIDRMTKFLVTKYIVQTETAKKELTQRLNLPENKFEVIPNSINISEYEFELDKDAKKKELGVSPENLNIICVSKLRKGKGHEYLFEAFEKIYATHRNINLLIIGSGEREDELADQIKNYQSRNNIYFLGERNDVKEILKISDIFVLPTLGEGMSNAIMEAMATGLPVITTNIEVNKELIRNNETGTLVSPKNDEEIKEAILSLIENKEFAIKIGLRGREKVYSSFNMKKTTDLLTYILNKI